MELDVIFVAAAVIGGLAVGFGAYWLGRAHGREAAAKDFVHRQSRQILLERERYAEHASRKLREAAIGPGKAPEVVLPTPRRLRCAVERGAAPAEPR